MKRKCIEEHTRPRRPIAAALLIAVGLSAQAQSQIVESDLYSIRGFGTLAATTHNADGIEFRRSTDQAQGVSAGDVDFATDSQAGLQINFKLAPHLDAVVQGVARERADGSWNPRLSQGFIRYSPDDALVIRAGRVGYDIYLLAESRQVGYSYLALRPSVELYGMVTDDQIDGVDAAITLRTGAGLVRARVFGGNGASDTAFRDDPHVSLTGAVAGACLDYLYRGWTARLAVLRFQFDANPALVPLIGALRATGSPQAAAIADNIDLGVYKSTGIQLGVAYENGPLQAQLLIGAASGNTLTVPEFDKYYALVGYQLHRWTPFLSYGDSRDRHAVRGAGLPDIPQLAPLDAAVRQIQESSRSTQKTFSAGVRFDLSEHVDFKMQVDRTALGDSRLVFDERVPPGGPANMTVLGASVDFVF